MFYGQIKKTIVEWIFKTVVIKGEDYNDSAKESHLRQDEFDSLRGKMINLTLVKNFTLQYFEKESGWIKQLVIHFV